MKIYYFSDLHLEFENINIKKFHHIKNDDIVILAGDIGVGLMARKLVEQLCNLAKHVLLVAGNHEYYSNCVRDIKSRWSNIGVTNFTFLDNQAITINDVTFIGGTMWTSLSNPVSEQLASDYMNDYKCIRNGKELITTKFTKTEHEAFKTALLHHLEKPAKNIVVVTHHAPCHLSIDQKYIGDQINDAYYEDMTSVMDQYNINYWIHGHVHNSFDYGVYNTRVLSNPKGYKDQNKDFKFDKFFEI